MLDTDPVAIANAIWSRKAPSGLCMTPDTITKATKALASDTTSWSEARVAGEAFGRALAAQIKARAIATDQMNQAATTMIEMSLLQLAACGDELVAEIADSALREIHGPKPL